MRRAAVIIIILSAALLAACAPPNTGVNGAVNVGPACPANTSCPPDKGPVTINVANALGDPVTSVTADSQGTFKIPLSPGTYIVQPSRGSGIGPGNIGPPVVIDVVQGRYTLVKLSISE
jgi:hypothetical protein